MIMKKLTSLLSLLLFVSLVFTSCKKDEEVTPTPTLTPAPTETKLLASLSTSKANYQSATAGSWVTITEAEYNKLATDLANVTVSGMPQASFGTGITGEWTNISHTTVLTGSSVTKVPTGSFLFAFKFVRYTNNTSTGSRVKLSQASETDGFTNLGGVLPDASGTATSTHYYVIKDNNTATTATNAYVGFFCNGSVIAASTSVANVRINWGQGDVSIVSAAANTNEVHYQSLSTTTKQW